MKNWIKLIAFISVVISSGLVIGRDPGGATHMDARSSSRELAGYAEKQAFSGQEKQGNERLDLVVNDMSDRLNNILPDIQESIEKEVLAKMEEAGRKIEKIAEPLVDRIFEQWLQERKAAIKKEMVTWIAQQALNRGIQHKLKPFAEELDQGFKVYLKKQLAQVMSKDPKLKTKISYSEE